ncbi:Similar to SKP2: S-phase kinase-associated protein 2 (Homo sapiens) [Cotesia congregata]|uniref:Similar to SKP2: S-phase kinase-associated protein 2 (Homo sapiens) n=1 Tax=Cotesia congregata TaxID=51543 RepID=A0A8J2HRJ0_COTCN|nr:Similar to SKP2: S-phase kinase-associated protein 2 (Homo sapiens) [Cotesia congregata]
MNAVMEENTRLSDDYPEESGEYSPPESKRMKLDDGCNNNLNSTLNSESKNGRRWSYRGDTSLVEPEVLVDLGVSMLDDDASLESFKKPLDQDSYHSEDPAVYSTTGNESGYSSRIGNEVFADKQNYSKNESSSLLNTSDADQYYLFRRKKRPSIVGEDEFNKLSDEMVLMIFKWLPKKCLVRSMSVCRRWCQIARDEALWTRLDLSSKVLAEGTLGHILPRGVQILRLAQAELSSPLFSPGSLVLCEDYSSKLQYLDLSMAVISPDGLTDLIDNCRLLKKLSLEKCTLNQASCEAISKNNDINTLNLTMCEELDLSDCTLLTIISVQSILSLSKLEHLSLSRCYSISPSSYVRLAYMPSLSFLDVFGLMSEPMFKNLQNNSSGTEINKFLYSSIARPTVGVRRTSIWGLRVRD